MYKLVEISKEEYLALGDLGAWVWGGYGENGFPDLVHSPSDSARFWLSHKSSGYTNFYTRVPDDVQP